MNFNFYNPFSTLKPYTWAVDSDKAPFSVKYTFTGADNTVSPQLSQFGGAYTYGAGMCFTTNLILFFTENLVAELNFWLTKI